MDIVDHPVLSPMRLLANRIPRGYHCYVSGTVPFACAERMMGKFQRLYGATGPRALERRRRCRHGAIVRIVLVPDGRIEDRRLQWLTIVSDKGGGPVAELERLRDARGKHYRIRVGWYELVRAPRMGQGMRHRGCGGRRPPNPPGIQARSRPSGLLSTSGADRGSAASAGSATNCSGPWLSPAAVVSLRWCSRLGRRGCPTASLPSGG